MTTNSTPPPVEGEKYLREWVAIRDPSRQTLSHWIMAVTLAGLVICMLCACAPVGEARGLPNEISKIRLTKNGYPD